MQLKPEAEVIPKCLLKVGSKSVIEHTLTQFPREIREVIIVVGRLKEKIRKHIGTNFLGRAIRYIEQVEPLGTGHALFTAKDALDEKKFLVLMGDNLYVRRDIESCLRRDLCLLAQRLEAPERFGIVRMEDGVLVDVMESRELKAGTLINCGLYVLDHRIFGYPLVPIGEKEYGLPQAIAKMSRAHPVAVERASFWMPIATMEDLKRADKYIKKIYS